MLSGNAEPPAGPGRPVRSRLGRPALESVALHEVRRGRRPAAGWRDRRRWAAGSSSRRSRRGSRRSRPRQLHVPDVLDGRGQHAGRDRRVTAGRRHVDARRSPRRVRSVSSWCCARVAVAHDARRSGRPRGRRRRRAARSWSAAPRRLRKSRTKTTGSVSKLSSGRAPNDDGRQVALGEVEADARLGLPELRVAAEAEREHERASPPAGCTTCRGRRLKKGV